MQSFRICRRGIGRPPLPLGGRASISRTAHSPIVFRSRPSVRTRGSSTPFSPPPLSHHPHQRVFTRQWRIARPRGPTRIDWRKSQLRFRNRFKSIAETRDTNSDCGEGNDRDSGKSYISQAWQTTFDRTQLPTQVARITSIFVARVVLLLETEVDLFLWEMK